MLQGVFTSNDQAKHLQQVHTGGEYGAEKSPYKVIKHFSMLRWQADM